jgi:dTDP-4-dehydrorhamnose 3,5-epimerase/CDP-3, 6-dideoxy-D-glycero-D-glycero-4-hexulose-5-epimerase
MFEIVDEPLAGLKLIQPRIFNDERGSFIKSYHSKQMKEFGIEFSLEEEFYSISKRNVLRGMHFQLPPHAHDKIVYCLAGEVLDVVLDIRKGSDTYGQSYATQLSANNRQILFIPKGIAHGFLSLSENSCMVYKTSAVYAPEADSGILWNSFEFNWPTMSPILSSRDSEFVSLSNFKSPFLV